MSTTRQVPPLPDNCSEEHDCSDSMTERTKHSPGAWAVTREETPQIFLADEEHVISRLLALKLVAAASPTEFTASELEQVRDHLLHERWADALVIWMNATGIYVDVYPEYVHVWNAKDLDAELASMAIRTSRLFEEP